MVSARSLLPALAAVASLAAAALPMSAPTAGATTGPAPTAAAPASALSASALSASALSTSARSAAAPASSSAPASGPATPIGSAPGAADPTEEPTDPDLPLTMSIDSLSPASLPEKGDVTLTGTVTNASHERWSEIEIYPFASEVPITTKDQLTSALAQDPAVPVGDRITDGNYFDPVGDLGPGESTSWEVEVPRRVLVANTAPGIYWVGAHALGENADGRLIGADGKARTFIPQVPSDRSLDLALVLPVRHGSPVTGDGRLTNPDGLQRAISPGGRLSSIVELGAAAQGRPITWLVDPSVPEAVQRLGAGNHPRSLDAPDADDKPEDGEETDQPDDEETFDQAGGGKVIDPAAQPADRWLRLAGDAMDGGEILNLPWGDLDVSAAADHDPEMYVRARKRSTGQLQPWGHAAIPAISPPGGYLSQEGLELASGDTVALINDRMTAHSESPDAPVIRSQGSPVAVYTEDAAEGGPGPDDPAAPVAVRQRLLSEAALRVLAGDGTDADTPSMIAMLPSQWPPGAGSDFFAGLDDADWIQQRTVTDLYGGKQPQVAADDLVYPSDQRRLELPDDVFVASAEMIHSGGVVDQLLPDVDDLAARVSQDALMSVSYYNRDDPALARLRAIRGTESLAGPLDRITVTGPTAATLASDTGNMSATVTNGMDQPIEIRVIGDSDPGLEITPSAVVRLEPGGRTTQLLSAKATETGVQNVTLRVVTRDGTPVGASDVVPLRSGQVSDVIWVIMAVGLALLFGAVVVRGVRRAVSARRERRESSA